MCNPTLVPAGCGGTKGSIQPMNLVRYQRTDGITGVRPVGFPMPAPAGCGGTMGSIQSMISWSVQFKALTSHLFFFNSARSTQATWWFTPTHTVLLRQGKLEKKRCKACGAVWLRRHYAQHKAHVPDQHCLIQCTDKPFLLLLSPFFS